MAVTKQRTLRLNTLTYIVQAIRMTKNQKRI